MTIVPLATFIHEYENYLKINMLDASQSKHKTLVDCNPEVGIHLMFSTQIMDLNPSYPHDGYV